MLHVPAHTGNYGPDHSFLIAELGELARIGELTIEDFAVVDARYHRLAAAGYPFAPEFKLLMRLLEKQAMHTDDDPDSDTSVDDGLENDDPNDGLGDDSAIAITGFDDQVDDIAADYEGVDP